MRRTFHGRFGLITLQSIKKPAFYAYQFLNQLGKQELKDEDSSSWICRDDKGNIQALIYDFTDTLIKTSNDSKKFYSSLSAEKRKGKLILNYTNIASGRYSLSVYKTGNHINDPYSNYLEMGSPSQLTKQQEEAIKQKDSGAPIMQKTAVVGAGKTFTETFDLNENDVFLITLNKK